MKKDKAAFEVEKQLTPDLSDRSAQDVEKKSGRSPLLIVLGIIGGVFVFLMLIVVAGYAIFSREELSIEEELGQVTQAQYELLNDKLEACENDLVVNESCADDKILAIAEEVPAVNSNSHYKIEFLYPEYLYRNYAPMAAAKSDTLAFYMARDFADTLVTEMSEDVFLVTHNFSPFNQPEEYGDINIMGKSYPVIKSARGGGFGSGSFMETFYTVKLEEDLYITVVENQFREASYCMTETESEAYGLCSEDPRCNILEDCTDFEPEVYSEYKTTDEELEQLFDIMESFKYTRTK